MSKPQTTAVAAPRKDLKDLLQGEQFKNAVALCMPKHLTPERFVRVALTALMRTPQLQKCSQESLFKCLLDLSALGLEPDGRRAHLIPFGSECTLIIDYKGLVELMMRSGLVANIHADVVCENDEFEYDRGEVTKHRIDFRKDRGPVYAVYCRVTMKDGSTKCEALSRREVEAVRGRSRAKDNGPWVTDWNEMAKKTACRRVSKWVPLSVEFREAVDTEDELERNRERESGVIDLGMFRPSADENRGHELAAAADVLKEAQAEHFAKLPEVEELPDPRQLEIGSITRFDGKFFMVNMEHAWESYVPGDAKE